ncbi:hypothetical protein DOTSEDRAFT_81183 [Dothistroma septosporum NZE10]|uniref:Glycoside hydrolase family 93 protein n=1 Tax=Dothistroma septosporum (strain NZE10 / CBS 128990) TaxID=675120 RepID=N1PIP0_DOTSN|nr:hypothetical protein DOTSEDRAFT_81183 [Dothistroma septosporum NZE10]
MYTPMRCLWATAVSLPLVSAVNGGSSPNAPTTYTSGSIVSIPGGSSSGLKSGDYQYTGFGAAESNINIAQDGSLIYSPAFTTSGVGYATSKDSGNTWAQVLPGGSAQPRTQPVFRKVASSDRYFFWSSSIPGLDFNYSDDDGTTWTNLNASHFDQSIQDWAKLVNGKPVRSKLTNGAKEILYLSAPSLISTPIPVQPLGPIDQMIIKSTDGGSNWTVTGSQPTLQPALSGGACAGLTQSLLGQELIIWGDGFVTPNGTIMYGLRRCQKLSVAISDDEGDTWRFSDLPQSSLVPFIVGDLTYTFDGNVLVPEPISMDISGNIYAIYVDSQYVLKMSVSKDFANTWSAPIVIAAPGNSTTNSLMTYLPTLRQHPTQAGRAALSYYGSSNGGATYNAYMAETVNLGSSAPTWTSIIANPPSQPMQNNSDRAWDQGYGNPLGDLIEFTDILYMPNSTNFVAAFARKMCTAPITPFYDGSSCVDGWNYTAHGNSAFQGFVAFGKH